MMMSDHKEGRINSIPTNKCNRWLLYRTEHHTFYIWHKCKNIPIYIPYHTIQPPIHFDEKGLLHSVPFGFNLSSNQSCSKLFILDNMVMDGDIYVVKDVKGILFIKVGLENKTKT